MPTSRSGAVMAAVAAACVVCAAATVSAVQVAVRGDPRITPSIRTVPRDGSTWVKPIMADALKDDRTGEWIERMRHVDAFTPLVARAADAVAEGDGRDDAMLLASEEDPCALLPTEEGVKCANREKSDEIFDKHAGGGTAYHLLKTQPDDYEE